jgi:hypothetical protein
MKIALYIEDGLEQIVLTAESDTERSILAKLHDGERDLSIKRGGFYPCQGGWVRQHRRYGSLYGGDTDRDDDSTMIVLRPRAPDPAPLPDEVSE